MSGLKVMLVEDEAILALMMEDMLCDLGCEVVGSFGDLASAFGWLQSAAEPPEAALLDVNLGGQTVFPLAAALADHHIPFAFASGYAQAPGQRFATVPLLHKPVDPDRLAAVLAGFRVQA